MIRYGFKNCANKIVFKYPMEERLVLKDFVMY